MTTKWKKGQSGNPAGRPKGSPNKRVKYAEEFAQSFLIDSDFQDAVRNILANPHHEHWQWTVEMIMNYAYGKPVEHVHQTSDGSLPAHQYNIAWVNYDAFFDAVGSDSHALPAQAPQLSMADHQGDSRGEKHHGGNASPRGEN